jgi:catechol 2,3-dioxygenase-like lactoylglutathione lyase family enzyme
MKIRVIGIPVHNQEKALRFYTEKLDFIKKLDIPLGNENRWLTVIAKDEPDGPELLLEPSSTNFEPAKI